MTREPIYAALFAMISSNTLLKIKSRKFRHFSDVDAADQPALFQVQTREVPITVTGQPTQWKLMVDLYLYANSGETDTPPSSQINLILDAITNLFDPNPISAKQTLGGLVHYVRVSGSIETDEGLLGPQGIAIIPIEILVP